MCFPFSPLLTYRNFNPRLHEDESFVMPRLGRDCTSPRLGGRRESTRRVFSLLPRGDFFIPLLGGVRGGFVFVFSNPIPYNPQNTMYILLYIHIIKPQKSYSQRFQFCLPDLIFLRPLIV